MLDSETVCDLSTDRQAGVNGPDSHAHDEEGVIMASNGVLAFQSNLAHLQDEIGLLNLRLSREVHRIRQHYAGPDAGSNGASGGSIEGEFRGLVVSEDHIDTVLWQLAGEQELQEVAPSELVSQIKRREEEIETSRSRSLELGVPLRLERLRTNFQLSSFDIGVIMLGLAPELDLRYEVIYGYLQEDVSKKQPTVNLALNLLCNGLSERVERRRSLFYPAPLVKHNLVHVGENTYSKDGSFLGQPLSIDRRISDYLLGSDTLGIPIQRSARVMKPITTWPDLILPQETRDQLQRLVNEITEMTEISQARHGESPLVLQLVGPGGTGKKAVAQALCHSLSSNLFLVDSAKLLSTDLAPETAVSHGFRESKLQDAILCVENFHLLLIDDPRAKALVAAFSNAFEQETGLSIVLGETRWRPQRGFAGESILTLELSLPDYADRALLWQNHLGENLSNLPAEEIASLASKFRFSGGQIQQAVTTARGIARWRSDGVGEITSEDLYASSRWHSNQRLELLAQRIYPRYALDDIVLPPDQKSQLLEICCCFENMPQVYESWGFQSKTSLGKGLNILFAGPSGTGKTMAAEIMASQLGLDLYKIDLSTMVSKYIGETEKNLDRIFREAEDSNAILFFDEADALFGKRSEVRDAHDRYANIEVSYLLQKMEEYQGITILTTNFRKNMDDAFVRRLHFAVEFPVPEEEYRLLIWQRVFPESAPLDPDVDLAFLARQFKVAGGNIKNVAVTAAFLAAQKDKSIKMDHVIQAVKREFQKMGKLLVENDFKQYFEMVSR